MGEMEGGIINHQNSFEVIEYDSDGKVENKKRGKIDIRLTGIC